MATIVDPKTFTVTNTGDSVITAETLNASLGMIVQFRVPELDIGDSVRIGLSSTDATDAEIVGESDVYFSFFRQSVGAERVLNANIRSEVFFPDDVMPYVPGDMYSIYADNHNVIFFHEGIELLSIDTYLAGNVFRFKMTYDATSTGNPITFSDVLYYSTGKPGLDGPSLTTINTPNPNHILDPTKYRFTATESITSFESVNGDTEGAYVQFQTPATFTGGPDEISIGLASFSVNGAGQLVSDTTYTFKLLVESGGSFPIVNKIVIMRGNVELVSRINYQGDAICSIYADSVNIHFKINGIVVATESQPTGRVFFLHGSSVLDRFVDIRMLRFYPTGKIGDTGIQGPSVLGNVLRVDQVNGYNPTASIGGLPYETIQAALSAIVSAGASGKTIWVLPGTYTLSEGITIPDGCSIRGVSLQTCVLQMNVTNSATMITMGANTRVEDLTINLTCTGSTNEVVLRGIVFPDVAGQSTSQSAKLRTCVLTVRNSTMGKLLDSTVTGVEFTGTGVLTKSSFSFNSIKGSTINVFSNGKGNKRGILVSNSNQVSTRDTNIYVAQPPDTDSIGSYVGVETNDGSTGSIQLRSTTIGTVTPTGIEAYTASDILQTTPALIDNPSYLASPGIQLGPGVDLVTKTAGGKAFSTYNYPTTLFYGCRGTIQNVPAGWLWLGTNEFQNGKYPDTTTPAARYRIQQPAIVSGIQVSCNVGPAGADSIVVTVCKNTNGSNGGGAFPRTPNGATLMTTTLNTANPTSNAFYNGSVNFAAGDYLSVYFQTNSTIIQDVSIQLDMF
jgi:hypothetical protein